MSKCFVNVCGGLGNQLFQIANGYAYSKKNNKEMYINDMGWTASQGSPPSEYESTIFRNFSYKKTSMENVTQINEKSHEFSELDYVMGDVALNGYFQSLKYFEEYREEFESKLWFPEVKLDFLKPNNVAFHIRRGDYLKFAGIHFVCNTEYFINMFEEFWDYQINVFTDSPEYVLNEFKDFNFNLIQTTSNLKDLTFMSQHDNIVCSNSSFSWWASILGKTKDKIIVPKKWFNDRVFDSIYTENMIRV